MKAVYILIGLSFLLQGCQKTVLGADEYLAWVQEPAHGLKQEKDLGGLKFILQYQTAEYTAILESKRDKGITLDSLIAQRQQLQYFTFRMLPEKGNVPVMKTGIRSQEEYIGRQQYASLEIEKDFKLVDGKDTFPCALFNAEQNYNAAPYADFVLAFPKPAHPSGNNDKLFIYNDVVFNLGKITFRIASGDLETVQKLKVQKK